MGLLFVIQAYWQHAMLTNDNDPTSHSLFYNSFFGENAMLNNI